MKKLNLFILSILTLTNISFAEIIACKTPACSGHSHSHEHSEEDEAALIAKAKALGLDKFIVKGKTNNITLCENAIISINGNRVDLEQLEALLALFTKEDTIYFSANKNAQMFHIAKILDEIRESKAKLISISASE